MRPEFELPFLTNGHRRRASAWSNISTLLRTFPDRLTEPAFWLIQGSVVSVTVVHGALEATGFWERRDGVLETLPHTPMILLIAPIMFAGFRYGLEGGLLTAIWAALLTIPNVVFWHVDAYAWVGEMSYLLVIVVVGVLVSVPVDREKRQRIRAVDAGRRLALLNEATSILAASNDLAAGLRRVAARLNEMLGFRGTSIRIDGEPNLTANAGALVTQGWRSSIVVDEGPIGSLCITTDGDREPEPEDADVLHAVAAQIGVAVYSRRLHERERDHLRSYVHHVTRAQEAERKRISRNLHDEAAQSLVLLCRRLDALSRGTTSREELVERIGEMRPLAEETLAGIRRFSRDLRPPILDDLGLGPALESLTATVSLRSSVEATMSSAGTRRRLDPEVELTLYRIAQEALRNVERHARARHAQVSVSYEPHEIELTICDDGIGFRPTTQRDLPLNGRLGLIGMEERAQLIGGALSVHSAPGIGTTIRVRCPIDDAIVRSKTSSFTRRQGLVHANGDDDA